MYNAQHTGDIDLNLLGEEELLLVQARQLAAVLDLARQDSGGAIDATTASSREQTLRELGALVRRARVAAYNAYGLPS